MATTYKVDMILDDMLPHDMGEYQFDHIVTPIDVESLADETLKAYEQYYSPERMQVVIGTEVEVIALIEFDESGTYTLNVQ